VHSDSLDKALIGPLAQQSPAGFLFLEAIDSGGSIGSTGTLARA